MSVAAAVTIPSASVPPTLAAAVARDVLELLAEVHAEQQELLRLTLEHQARARRASSIAVDEQAELHGASLQRLQGLLQRRSRILQAANTLVGTPRRFSSLASIVEAWSEPLRQNGRVRLERVAQSTRELQRESWILWVTTNRCAHFCGEVLELFANCGERPATYESGTVPPSTQGGVMLDASA